MARKNSSTIVGDPYRRYQPSEVLQSGLAKMCSNRFRCIAPRGAAIPCPAWPGATDHVGPGEVRNQGVGAWLYDEGRRGASEVSRAERDGVHPPLQGVKELFEAGRLSWDIAYLKPDKRPDSA